MPAVLPSKEERIAQAATANAAVAERLAAIREEQTARITSKKRKRLEKFIEKELKKEERVKLFEKLNNQKFSSELLQSSKKLGSGKLTARERLRLALLEERQGVQRSDPSVSLVVEKSAAGHDGTDTDEQGSEDDPAGEGSDDDISEPEMDAQMDASSVLGIVSRAFGASQSMPERPVIVASSELGTTTVVSDALPPVSVASVLSVKPVAGSGLKRKAPESDAAASQAQPSKRVLKKRQRLEAKRAATATATATAAAAGAATASHSDSDDDSRISRDDDSSGDDDDEDTAAGATAGTLHGPQKTIWASDIVAGEKLPTQPAVPGAASGTRPSPNAAVKATARLLQSKSAKKAFHVPVSRPEDIQIARMALPVVGEEQPIMEAILDNDITILCGETGSGKTTQVPQFLYEAGFGDKGHPRFPGMIGVTQPRRVAAVSMAKRVAHEMNLHKGEVAYQIRYDKGLTSQCTRIKFMTDGILLRELSGGIASTPAQAPAQAGASKQPAKPSSDILLSDYSCIIIDEAHERTVGTDVLIGWLTRIVRLRNSGKLQGVHPLKLVIMSATLRVQDFTENKALFPESVPPPPVIKVDGRQHRVVVHYNKRTPELDYVSEALKKVTKIHTKLPPGGVLVFVTGQQEVQVLVRKLRKAFPADSATGKVDSRIETAVTDADADAGADAAGGDAGVFGEAEAVADPREDDLDAGSRRGLRDGYMDRGGDEHDDFEELEAKEDEDAEEEEVHVLGGTADDPDDGKAEDESYVPPAKASPLHVLPLYSLLPTSAQMRVFDPPPEGARLVVIATNVAETSLTIPGIRYVVDCGKVKERRYDSSTGVQTFQVSWTSKASADQRAGRAGRMGPGHCYRLFSSAVFNDYFDQFSTPEIMRVPIEDVVMQMKSMGINQVINFPFPTPPSKANLQIAERLLKYLGALETPSAGVAATRPTASAEVLTITELGRLMARFPVSPRHSKMLVIAAKQSSAVLPYIVAIVAGLSVGDPIMRDHDLVSGQNNGGSDDDEQDTDEKDERRKQRGRFFQVMQAFAGANPTSDLIRTLGAIGAFAAEHARSPKTIEAFCERHFLRLKAMDEIAKLRTQITTLLRTQLADHHSAVVRRNVANLTVDPQLPPPDAKMQSVIRQVILTGFPDRVARLSDTAVSGYGKRAEPVYQTLWANNLREHHLIHPASCLHGQRPAPKWIVYDEVVGREELIAADRSGALDLRGHAAQTPGAQSAGEPAKRWLKAVTVINEPWLPAVCPPSLVRTGRVLEQPEPRYVPERDVVVGYVVPVFGPALWELGVTETVRDLDDATRTAWFAKALLEGTVLGSLGVPKNAPTARRKDVFALLGPFMATKPSVMTKSWARGQSKVARLLDTLAGANVASRAALVAKWQADRSFLCDAVAAWVPVEFQPVLEKHWPPIVRGNACNAALHSAIAEIAQGGGDLASFKRSSARAGVDSDEDSN
nr:ATP-dependent RNA helicase dhx37 [Polyrhizophydium stewartii]